MSWIPAPEAHLEAGEVGPGFRGIDHLGLSAASSGGPALANGEVFLPRLHFIGHPSDPIVGDQHVEAAVGILHDADVVGAAERGLDLEKRVFIFDGGATCQDGKQEKDRTAHFNDSNDGWIKDYIGLPFLERGRDRDGLDCWGLIRLVYLERLGISLPVWREGYADVRPCPETAGHLAACASTFAEIGVGDERAGDILLFRTGQHLSHVGLCLSGGRMLHILEGIQSALEQYRTPRWLPRLAGVYRV